MDPALTGGLIRNPAEQDLRNNWRGEDGGERTPPAHHPSETDIVSGHVRLDTSPLPNHLFQSTQLDARQKGYRHVWFVGEERRFMMPWPHVCIGLAFPSAYGRGLSQASEARLWRLDRDGPLH